MNANRMMWEGLFVFSLKIKSVMPFLRFSTETSAWYYEYIKIGPQSEHVGPYHALIYLHLIPEPAFLLVHHLLVMRTRVHTHLCLLSRGLSSFSP